MKAQAIWQTGLCLPTLQPGCNFFANGSQVFLVRIAVLGRGVTIRYPHDTIRIAILESRYDTYHDTW